MFQSNFDRKQSKAMFAYLFGKIKNAEFRKFFENGIQAKKEIDKSGYILKNCKLYAYHYHYSKTHGLGLPRPGDYKVTVSDANLLKLLDLSHINDQYKPLSLKYFDQLLEEFLTSKDIRNYVGRFISRKMMFLIRSYGMDRSDIESLLFSAAIYTIYRQYPLFDSKLHFFNTGKTGIHNAGHSLIIDSTTNSRQVLLREEGGLFSNRLTELSNLQLEAPVEDSYVKDRLGDLAKIEHRIGPKFKRFLYVMCGEYDEEFSTFIGEDNSQAIDTMRFVTYKSKVYKFFNTNDEKLEKLYSQIRKVL